MKALCTHLRNSTNSIISVFSPSGDKLRSLVADKDNHRIQKFTAEGQFITAVGTNGSGPLQFNEVEDIAINTSNNKVYVVDNYNHLIQVLNSNLTFSNTIGKYVRNKGKLNHPCATALGMSMWLTVRTIESKSLRPRGSS